MKTLKQIKESALSSRAQTAVWPSHNASYDSSHTKTPYHKNLKAHGYNYTHSVKQNQYLTIHHYANADNHHVKVSTRVEHKMEVDPHYPHRNEGKGKEY
jgi:hypothetical protein